MRQSGKTFSSAEESIPGKCSISCNFSSKSWVGICHWRVWFLDTEHWKKKISKYHSPANLWGFTYLISSVTSFPPNNVWWRYFKCLYKNLIFCVLRCFWVCVARVWHWLRSCIPQVKQFPLVMEPHLSIWIIWDI